MWCIASIIFSNFFYSFFVVAARRIRITFEISIPFGMCVVFWAQRYFYSPLSFGHAFIFECGDQPLTASLIFLRVFLNTFFFFSFFFLVSFCSVSSHLCLSGHRVLFVNGMCGFNSFHVVNLSFIPLKILRCYFCCRFSMFSTRAASFVWCSA